MQDKVYVNARFLTQELTGVQRFAIELSKQLKALPIECIFLSPKEKIVHQSLAKSLETIFIGKYTGHLWEQTELPRYLKSIGSPLLINLMSTAPIFYSNKIYTLHDITFVRFPKNFSWKFRTFYKIMIPYMLKTSHRIITVSNFSKKEISNHYGINEDKFSVVHNGIKELFINPRIKEKDKKTQYFLTVSSINENKNLKRLIRAFNLININDLKLYIVGRFDLRSFREVNELQELLRSKRVIFKDDVSDEELAVLYKNAISFLFPSLYEGFGIPPLEAQGSGCPVLLSNIDSLKEIYGPSVLYFNPLDVNDMYTKMVMLVNDLQLRNDLSLKGNMNVKKYSWNSSAKSLVSIIKETNNRQK